MHYKYENYELESLKRYFNDNSIKTLINDIMSNNNSGILNELNNFAEFRALYSDILNIFSLSCKYGANNEINANLFCDNKCSAITRYNNFLDEEENTSFIFNNFTLLYGERKKKDDILFYIDDNFISEKEVLFIDVYDLLGEFKNTYIVPPFVEVMHGQYSDSFEILPSVSYNGKIEGLFEQTSEEMLYQYFKTATNNMDSFEDLSQKIKEDLHNNLIDLDYKYITGPKSSVIRKGGRTI